MAPGIYDPLTAHLAAAMGFETLYLGGWATGAHLGYGEPLLGLTDQVAAARRITSTCKTPLLVDGNAGFGEAVHVQRTVAEFEAAGVAGIHIEDQIFPKRMHYHVGVEHVVSRDEFLTKLRSGLAARTDPNFLLIARTDAACAVNGSIDEAIWRCQAALELGADAVFPLVLNDAQRRAVRTGLPESAPAVVLAGYDADQTDLSIDEYSQLGYRIILYPLASLVFAVGAVSRFLAVLKRDGRSPAKGLIGIDVDEYRATQSQIEAAIGLPEKVELEATTSES